MSGLAAVHTGKKTRSNLASLAVFISVNAATQASQIVGCPGAKPGPAEVGDGSTRRRHVIVVQGDGQAIECGTCPCRIEGPTRSDGLTMCRRPQRLDGSEENGRAFFDDSKEIGQVRAALATCLLERFRSGAQLIGAEVSGGAGNRVCVPRGHRRIARDDGGAQCLEDLPLSVSEPQQHPFEAGAVDPETPQRAAHIDALEYRVIALPTAQCSPTVRVSLPARAAKPPSRWSGTARLVVRAANAAALR